MIRVRNFPSGPIMTNTYLAFEEESKKGFIVDPGGYSKQLTQWARKENIDVEYIILTHGHSDHIGGVEEHLKDFPKAKVVGAEAEVPFFNNPDLNFSLMTHGRAIVVTPDKLVKEGDCLKVGSMNLKFIMTPGHTPGGMSILIDKILFSGDTLFRLSIGRTDFPGGSYEELKKSVHEKLFVLDDDVRVFPGHMGETTIGFEKENNPFV